MSAALDVTQSVALDVKSEPAAGLTPYRPRRTWSAGVRPMGGWRLKVYGMTAPGVALDGTLLAAGLEAAACRLPAPSATPLGFVLVHRGEQGVWLQRGLWADDILEQRVWLAPLGDTTAFGAAPFDDFAACVWELEVILHERDAWIRHVMAPPGPPSFEGYLGDVLSIPPGEG
ncbi:MAG: hypothetical protein AAGD06_10110 [Acidobacteriota bacterium]